MQGLTEREQLEVDVLFVGAGPASLSSAFHLSGLVRAHNHRIDSGQFEGKSLDPTILVVEKGREVGSHVLSGAVVDPKAFDELFAGLDVHPPYDVRVQREALYYLTETSAFQLPITPPFLKNEGYYVASLGRLTRWLAELCEERDIEVFAGFAAAQLLFDGESVVGVRMGDSGVNREGAPKANHEPGMEIRARVTILGEGPRGTLAGQALKRLALNEGRQPQVYALGVKELWQVDTSLDPGTVYHTFGFPLPKKNFGGGFLYAMKENVIAIGLVVGLDSQDPRTDGHRLLQNWKEHPLISRQLSGGKILSYGAKAIPEGGFYAMPRLSADGLLLIGDSAGFLNSQRLKGIHLAVKSGMLAAEAIFHGLLADRFTREELSIFDSTFDQSWAKAELWKVRNFRQAFQRGLWRGIGHAALQHLSGGRGLRDPFPIKEGHLCMEKVSSADFAVVVPDREQQELAFTKVTSVYYSDTSHEEDQPCHLKILDTRICDVQCSEEFGNPCQHFCPANVYEILSAVSKDRLQVNFTNCLHCKTCEIADPYQVILWTTPEGGGGPNWKNM